MNESIQQISLLHDAQEALKALVGLKLTLTRYAGNMRGFHFGSLVDSEGRRTGEFVLHVQCPWRLECHRHILTGRDDWYTPIGSVEDIDLWDPSDGNLQEVILRELFGGYDEGTRTIVNIKEVWVVTSVSVDEVGGLNIEMTGDYRLVVFPAATQHEAWRLFRPDRHDSHMVWENSGAD